MRMKECNSQSCPRDSPEQRSSTLEESILLLQLGNDRIPVDESSLEEGNLLCRRHLVISAQLVLDAAGPAGIPQRAERVLLTEAGGCHAGDHQRL